MFVMFVERLVVSQVDDATRREGELFRHEKTLAYDTMSAGQHIRHPRPVQVLRFAFAKPNCAGHP